MERVLERKAEEITYAEKQISNQLKMEREKAREELEGEKAKLRDTMLALESEIASEKKEVTSGAQRELALLQELERAEADCLREKEVRRQLTHQMVSLQHVVIGVPSGTSFREYGAPHSEDISLQASPSVHPLAFFCFVADIPP